MAECFVRLNPGAVCIIKVDNDSTIERTAALKPQTKKIESFGFELKCSALNKTFVYKSSVSFCIVYFRKALL